MNLEVDISPKSLRETLCSAQSLASLLPTNVNMQSYIDQLQALIDECDKHRPLGPDGKHGERHTATCGCEDKPQHGNWCDHSDCDSCFRASLRQRKCLVCGHDWYQIDMQGAQV